MGIAEVMVSNPVQTWGAWGEPKIGEKWGGGEREGGRGGEKRNRQQSIPNILPNSVRLQTGGIVQFDWLVARQSKSYIRNLTFTHNPTSGTRQDQNINGRDLGSVRIF